MTRILSSGEALSLGEVSPLSRATIQVAPRFDSNRPQYFPACPLTGSYPASTAGLVLISRLLVSNRSVTARAFPSTNPRGEPKQCFPGCRAVRSLRSSLSSECVVRSDVSLHHQLLDCSACRAAWLCATGGVATPAGVFGGAGSPFRVALQRTLDFT